MECATELFAKASETTTSEFRECRTRFPLKAEGKGGEGGEGGKRGMPRDQGPREVRKGRIIINFMVAFTISPTNGYIHTSIYLVAMRTTGWPQRMTQV